MANIPGKPSAERVFSDSVDIVWDGVRNFGEGDAYQVRIENTQTGQSDNKFFKKNRGNIRDVQPGATYVCKVRLVKANGEESKYSENSEEFKIKVQPKQKNRPGKPITRRVLVDSVDIEWDEGPIFRDNDAYQVFITNTKTGTWISKFFKENNAHISGLLPGTTYVFKVRLVKGNGEESEYSENSEEVRTKEEQKKEENIPGKPYAERMLSDSVDIVWDGVSNFSKGDAYQVRIENIQTGKWDCKFFTKNEGKIRDLQPGETYVLKVRLVKASGKEYKYSENSEKLKIKEETKQKDRPGKLITKTVLADSNTEKTKQDADRPGKPYVKEIYIDSVDIVWNSVQQFKKGDHYQVRLETVPKGKWEFQDYEINNVKIKGLKPSTSYLFKVRWVKSNGEESAYSEVSDIITTTLSFASKIVGESKHVKKGKGELDVYELPLKELLDARNESSNSKKFDIGPRNMNAINEKTIMLVGATGSGKSTFVDLLANYVFGVRLEDPFRFTVMSDEDRKKGKDEAQSQTDFISCYSFNNQAGTRINYRINVIDTPGFGDTCGKERDTETVEQIRQLFAETGIKGIQAIDAVCFLLKAPDARLTESQKNIFKGVLSLFSQDIEENICAVITFADGGEPKVLAAVHAEKITFNKIFRFNNSALFSDPRNNSLISTFWNMGLQSLDELFNHINTLQPKSIQLTKQVLIERHHLEQTYQKLQKSICESIKNIESLNKEMNIYKKNEKNIEKNKDFKYVLKEEKKIKGKLSENEWATNCSKCQTTCHGNCNGIMESLRGLCWVMCWLDGDCCKCFCRASNHTRENYRYFIITEDVEKTYGDKLEAYQKAMGKKLQLADVLDQMENNIADTTGNIIEMLKNMTNCMNRLNEIALRPNVSGMSNPIDQMIHDEENTRMSKNEDRITILKKFRDIASGKVILQDTSDKRRHWKYFNSKP